MSASAEWETWRKARSDGRKTTEQWLTWAESYVSGLPDGEWKKHCQNHIRFVRRDADNQG